MAQSLLARYRYYIARASTAVDAVAVAAGQDPSVIASKLAQNDSETAKKISAEWQKPLLYKLAMTGNSMAPLLNENAREDEARDVLFIRRLPRPTEQSVFVRDVVVMRDPSDARRKYVRRIVAAAGDEMISDREPEKFPPFFIPDNHCWVQCDNPAAPTRDSRSFGAIRFDHIIGRAIYAVKNATEHYRIKNSDRATAEDDIILSYEKPALLLQVT
ncbi:Mitochondrial inner membrane protease subunit 2 [Porphyridium purpureum]|uniref:Mitochondrial inner membrane protease subunit 2 n=1 Tax=Porphyridium purpureum TaxID=35688 RepID=A0A5J4YI97_PORPP|nr:Mitochondrial inner membrane protease subunit 2 [Porphyridium purpureum]KAA8492071.1 Mitochondrial inner membrane protease subunit 2 [Porphyridium purpureum]|eukprot:POR1275..scf249_10